MRIKIALAAFAGVATLATLGGVAAAGATTATPAAATAAVQTTYTPPRAYIWDLSAGFHGYKVEMGHAHFLVTLTNISNHSVSLYGYPGLQLLNAGQQPLPTKTLWGSTYFVSNPGKSLIVLSPGEAVSADICYSVYGTPANSVLAGYLEVTPPNCYNHFTLKIPYSPALVYLHQVTVTAVARHTPYIP
jgi:Domain of unknown function (DUF4232)